MDVGYTALGTFLIIAYCVAFGVLSYRKFFRNKKGIERFLKPKLDYGMSYAFLITIFSLVLTIYFIPPTKPTEPDKVLAYADKEELYHQKFWAYYQKVQQNKFDYESLYELNLAEDQLRKKQQGYFLRMLLPDNTINGTFEYEKMCESADSAERELGYFGMAMETFINYKNKKHEVIRYLDSLKNKNKAFVNVLYSMAADDDHQAIEFLEKEIKNKGAVKTAAKKISVIYITSHEDQELQALYDNDEFTKFIPLSIRMDFAFANGYWFDYFGYCFANNFSGSNFINILGAILILGIWLYFLDTIDTYEKESRWLIVAVLIAGMLSTFLADFFYSTFHHYSDFKRNENNFHDFLYYIFVVGGIEELVKILPLLILVLFSKKVNEPIDYVFFAALSALGFSVLEDIMYFNTYSVHTIYSRGIFTSLTHIADTSFMAYALVLGRFYYQKWSVPLFIGGFFIAILTHGVYDFFILNDDFSLWIIPFIILMLETWWFIHIVTNCLNNATYYSQHLDVKTPKLGAVVCGGLVLLITLVYLHVALTMDLNHAIEQLLYASMIYLYPMYFLYICINRIDIFNGEWDNFSLKQFINPKIFFGGENPRYSTLVGKRIIIYPYGKQTRVLTKILPLQAYIFEREKFGDYKGWFKIIAEVPGKNDDKPFINLYFRTRDNEAPIKQATRNVVTIYRARDLKSIEKKYNKQLSDLVYVDLAEIKFLDIDPV